MNFIAHQLSEIMIIAPIYEQEHYVPFEHSWIAMIKQADLWCDATECFEYATGPMRVQCSYSCVCVNVCPYDGSQAINRTESHTANQYSTPSGGNGQKFNRYKCLLGLLKLKCLCADSTAQQTMN